MAAGESLFVLGHFTPPEPDQVELIGPVAIPNVENRAENQNQAAQTDRADT